MCRVVVLTGLRPFSLAGITIDGFHSRGTLGNTSEIPPVPRTQQHPKHPCEGAVGSHGKRGFGLTFQKNKQIWKARGKSEPSCCTQALGKGQWEEISNGICSQDGAKSIKNPQPKGRRNSRICAVSRGNSGILPALLPFLPARVSQLGAAGAFPSCWKLCLALHGLIGNIWLS